MKLLLCCIVLIVSVTCSHLVADLEGQWEDFKLTQGREYESYKEEMFRKDIFKEKLKSIHEHNLLYYKGVVSYKLGINQFSDKTIEEIYPQKHRKVNNRITSKGKIFNSVNVDEYPKEFDWRNKGVVTKPKHQGQHCKSCWAFAQVAAIESRYAIKTGKLVPLSKQNVVDCAMEHGCDGGGLFTAYKYVMNHGIDTEESYPYVYKEQPCQFKNDSIGATITDYDVIDGENENITLKIVATDGPVAVALDIVESLIDYYGGIYDDPECSWRHARAQHNALIVGYGNENGKDYWIVKNSWGEHWGENGYMRIRRNKNMCSIAELPTYPII